VLLCVAANLHGHNLYRKIAIVTLVRIFAGVGLLYGQDQQSPTPAASAPPVISTDRPAITDASTVVPNGYFVFENGFAETGSQGHASYDLPETLVRFGLTSTTELRFGAPDYFANTSTGAGFGTGWGDLSLGLKQQLPVGYTGFEASVVNTLSFPTGANIISSHGYDPEFLLPWSHPISKNWTAAGMFSILWPTEARRRNLTGQASFLIDRQITAAWDAFIEYGGEFPQRGGPTHIVHTGTSYKITPNQQLDFHVGFGVSAAAPDHFIGIGYSLQIQALHRNKPR
jgi:hypothetical protein